MTVNYTAPGISERSVGASAGAQQGQARREHHGGNSRSARDAAWPTTLVTYKDRMTTQSPEQPDVANIARRNRLLGIRAAGARYGLNLVAAIPADRYDRRGRARLSHGLLRLCGTAGNAALIVLIGNGGGDFWREFSDFADRNPGWRERANPLDDFTREIVEGEVVPRARPRERVAWRSIRS